jgi:2-keto-4-pentenoate hydratase/2-oxohepta-3-ene-1,7-dioic acid hydratase in catechol pathway
MGLAREDRMKLIGLRQGRQTLIGVVIGDRVAPVAEASAFYADLAPNLAMARAAKSGTMPLAGVDERPAVTPSARVLCVGLNYRAHAAEGGATVPDYPTIFGRWTASLVAGGTPVPCIDPHMDWEGELGVVIGKPATNVKQENALDHVLGYCNFNDISARAYQRHTSQWTPGKNGDRSGPMGPIITADETGDPAQGWRVQTRVNGQVMQDNNTKNMVFSVPVIIAYLSSIMTLNPGDLIASGTPEGVGYARKPPVFMKPGDAVEIEIGKLGVLRNPITTADVRP